MSNEWPKTVKVSGRKYEIHPDMTIAEITEVVQSIQNEHDKLCKLYDALGIDVENSQ